MAESPKSFYRYLLADSRDRDWGIYATSAGYVDIEAGDRYPPAGHPKRYTFEWKDGRELDEVQVHFIGRGSGIFESGSRGETRLKGASTARPNAGGIQTRSGREIAIGPGSAFIVFPGVWHRYAPHEATGWLEYWIGFKGNYADQLLKKHFFGPDRPVVTLPDTSALLHLFTEAVTCLRHHPAGAPRLLGALAGRILAELEVGAAAGSAVEHRAERIVQDAKDMLGQHLDREFELEFLAQKLNVGYHWLRRAFKRETGCSLHQYRLQLRINCAKFLLQKSDATVEEVAQRTGFENPYYFSQIFKRKTSRTPTGWRRETAGARRA